MLENGSRRVVYVSYDGLEDPLGRSQVLPYVEGLAARDHQFELITFEKPGVPLRVRERIGPNVHWTALRYHRTPTVPATAFDMAQGASVVALASLQHRASLLHVRSYVPATLVAPWSALSRTPVLFDMRGMWPDEKVDGGSWTRDGNLYRATKRIERTLLARSSAITVLTHSMQRHLRDEHAHRDEITASISVIPTCTDLEAFHPSVTPNADVAEQLGGALTLVYVGSLGTWYMSDEMTRFYLAWKRAAAPRATRFLLITRDEPSVIRTLLQRAGCADDLVHRPAQRAEVASLVRCGNAAVCFIRPSFSKRGSAPTKLGEMLGCGLPVAANIVGDMAEVLAGTDAGVVVDDMTNDHLERAAIQLLARASNSTTTKTARALAERWFSLEHAIDGYDRIYRSLDRLGRRGGAGDTRWPPQ